jgi:hypothetical protein
MTHVEAHVEAHVEVEAYVEALSKSKPFDIVTSPSTQVDITRGSPKSDAIKQTVLKPTERATCQQRARMLRINNVY